jgi:DNA-binding protein H-NS
METNMPMNLDTLNEKELLELRANVDRALKTLDARRKAAARKAAEVAAAEFGFSLNELLSAKAAAAGKGAAKYRNPADESQTWSGRGRQPAWFKAGMAAGRAVSDFEF